MMDKTWKVILCDRNENQVRAWNEALKLFPVRGNYDGHVEVSVVHGEIFQDVTKADAIVSPANSFGFMDGGIDLAYRNRFGMEMQAELQHDIETLYGGEILIGQAHPVIIKDPVYKFMISAPTMRVPARILDYTDVFLASRAAMREAISNTAAFSILFPGMGTGVGGVYPDIAAKMMLKGIDEAFNPLPFPKSLGEATGRQNDSVGEAYRRMMRG